jgi:hypothetical protein
VEILFGITPKSLLKSSSFKSLRSTSSSTGSSLSSSQQKSPTPRPCLVWDVKEDEIQILAMTTFNGNDPKDEDKVFPELERNFLLKPQLYLIKHQSTFEKYFVNQLLFVIVI